MISTTETAMNGDQVYALVVGIETYELGDDYNLPGPAQDGLNFIDWLLSRGVVPEHIRFFVSPLAKNADVQSQADKRGIKPYPATREAIDKYIRDELVTEQSRGEGLYVFWGGHGILTKTHSTTRRLFFADTNADNKLTLDVDSLAQALRTSAFGAGFERQAFFVDACANSYFQGQYDTFQGEAAGQRYSTTGEQEKAEQFVMFAAADYEVAKNGLGTGFFSSAVLVELQGQPLWPKIDILIKRIKARLVVQRQLEPAYLWIKNGSQERIIDELEFSKVKQDRTINAINELVAKVRIDSHDNIQSLHSTMPLWGVDHWVSIGELFVDVNVLDGLSNSYRAEISDLWEDFMRHPNHRSLDRIGLGRLRQRVSGLVALSRNTNLMVVGKPGSGKTTYLQHLVIECDAGRLQSHKIPVLIKLRDFVNDGRLFSYSIIRYLEETWNLLATETKVILEKGRLLLLLDGLDEVRQENIQAITEEIEQFCRNYPRVQVVITCRTQRHNFRFKRFDYIEVADFNESQARLFAEHWFKSIKQNEVEGLEESQSFLTHLFDEKNRLVRELAITPILLSLTCAVFHHSKKFYSKRSKLYEEGIDLLLEHWDSSRSIERDDIYLNLPTERKVELLRYIARRKFDKEQYVLFEETEIIVYISEFLGISKVEGQNILRAIESHHGLIIERSRKIWSFSHLTFQEYLLAVDFVRTPTHEALVCLFNELSRTAYSFESILLVLEMVENSNDLVKIKAAIDDMPKSHDCLQRFILWVNNKTSSVASSYASSIVRAFYFGLSSLKLGLASDLDPDFAKDLYSDKLSGDLLLDFRLTKALAKYPTSGEILPSDSTFLDFEISEKAQKLENSLTRLIRERIAFKKMIRDKVEERRQSLDNLVFARWCIENQHAVFESINSFHNSRCSESQEDFSDFSGCWCRENQEFWFEQGGLVRFLLIGLSDLAFMSANNLIKVIEGQGLVHRRAITESWAHEIRPNFGFCQAFLENYGSVLHQTEIQEIEHRLIYYLSLSICQFLRDTFSELSEEMAIFEAEWIRSKKSLDQELVYFMRKNRNIGHDWQFSKSQLASLDCYYNANKVLIYLMKSGIEISDGLQQKNLGTLITLSGYV
jgi:hypothetical protein